MRIGIYSPYLNILGGGERYILLIASLLGKQHLVDVFWSNDFKFKAGEAFGINLSNVNFVGNCFRENNKKILNLMQISLLTKKYDRFFYVTDGSLFYSFAKKNFLVIQVPQKSMYQNNFITNLKLSSWNSALVYSDYVKEHIKKWWKINIEILPAAINISDFFAGKKENIILSVGRFFPLPHSKKQDVLVEIFEELCRNGLTHWKLVLAGGVEEKGREFFDKVKKKVKDLPVELYPNIEYKKLLELYSKAKIYWHAAGYKEDLSTYPERAEHFGITTLEAMASGAVPVVFAAGGQKEVVQDKENGYFWNSRKELCEITSYLIKNEKIRNKISLQAKQRSWDFDIKIFKQKLDDLIR
jgi:glycosyltransferase involved in cell wall biosynthesis